jgi:hypothetical protein
MEKIGILYGHLEYITGILYVLWPFGIFSPALVYCVKKNLATLDGRLKKAEMCSDANGIKKSL